MVKTKNNLSTQIKLNYLYWLLTDLPAYADVMLAHTTTVSSINADNVIVMSCDVTLHHGDVILTSCND